ncbi:MAG: tyrosine-type recombinase/integrase [Acidaminococcaceae bacterium]|nr:tyrosine-type recombinase/integrase [Acidaminococcaceae bacterium]
MPKSKKSNGEGSISYESDRQMYRARLVSPDGKRISKRFRAKKEAMEWLAVTQADIYKNTYVSPNSLRLGDWLSEYLVTYKAPKVRPKTLERYIQTAKYLEPISGIELQKLTAHTVQQFYNELPQMSPSSKNKVHKLLKAAITKACAIDLMARNIMQAVEAPPVPKVEIQVFTKEEISKILQTAKNSRYYSKYYPFFLLAATTGARLGELLGLKTTNVKTGYIYIDNSLQAVRGALMDMPPKTAAGVRKITIAPEVIKVIRSTCSSSGCTLPFSRYVFHTRNGTPISPRNMERIWKALLKEAGVEYRNFHVLRHTMATQLLSNGVSIAEVAKRLGHSKISHTLNLYSHAVPNYDEGIPDILNKAYAL